MKSRNRVVLWCRNEDVSIKERPKNEFRSNSSINMSDWIIAHEFCLKNSLSVNYLTYDRLSFVVDWQIVERDLSFVDVVVARVETLPETTDLSLRPLAFGVGGVDDGVDDSLGRFLEEQNVCERNGLV